MNTPSIIKKKKKSIEGNEHSTQSNSQGLYHQPAAFQVLKSKDIAKIEIAKFMFKFKNKIFFISFVNYLTNLNEIYKYNTRQKAISEYYHHSFNSIIGKK